MLPCARVVHHTIEERMDNNQQINSQQRQSTNFTLRFLVIVGALVLIGFTGYYFGFLGFIYNVMIPEAFGNFPLIVLSIIFGIAAFFSPCSFTVLPAYVSHYLAGDKQKPGQVSNNIAKGFYFGLIAALGVLTINIIIGLIIAALGTAAPFAKDPRQDIPLILGVRVVAGLIIAYLGLMTVLGKHLEIPVLPNLVGRLSFGKSIFLYGMLYNGAAIGCTGPILLGLILYTLTSGSFTTALTAFIIFALTMGILMIALTTLTAIFKNTVAQKLAPLTPAIQKIAGSVMIFAGISIALLTLQGNKLFVEIFFPFLK